jgi:hypothetical protein
VSDHIFGNARPARHLHPVYDHTLEEVAEPALTALDMQMIVTLLRRVGLPLADDLADKAALHFGLTGRRPGGAA